MIRSDRTVVVEDGLVVDSLTWLMSIATEACNLAMSVDIDDNDVWNSVF